MGSTGHMIGCDWNWRGDTKAYLDYQNTQLHGPVTYRVLASTTKNNVYYAAVERVSVGTAQRDVFALAEPYTFSGKGYNRELIVKDQDESMGPVDAQCPNTILDKLTEPSNEYAAEWRKRCRENNAVAARKKAERESVQVGDTLLFARPLTFGGYGAADTFRVTSWGRRKRFVAITESGREFGCRLTRWALQNEFVVV